LHYGRPWKTSRFSADLLEPLNQLLGIKYNVKGAENIDKKKAYVVVCNHQSSLDVLAVLQVCDQ
jgi:1-acyl-sn-glycerol-3-phosphate acyltransferase